MARVAIGQREIGPVLSGQLAFFLRFARSSFKRVEPGHRPWLAEPFYLEERFADRAPTVARDSGAKPAFAGDHPLPPPGFGSRHPARALCKDWHRNHLLITSRTEIRLQDLSRLDLAALGFFYRDEFASHWDRESSLSGGRALRWRDNPAVLRFGFDLIRTPIPAGANGPNMIGVNSAPYLREAARAMREQPIPAPVPASPVSTLVEASKDFARRYQLPRHLSATVKNPIDLPARPVRRVIAPAETLAETPPAPAPAQPTEEKPVSTPSFSADLATPPSRFRAAPIPVAKQPPILGEVGFSTAGGDRAFLAALKREQPAGHTVSRPHTTHQRRHTFSAPPSATGTCPRCGTRIAYGCEHYPAAAVGDAA